jgi:hypothetical protein
MTWSWEAAVLKPSGDDVETAAASGVTHIRLQLYQKYPKRGLHFARRARQIQAATPACPMN